MSDNKFYIIEGYFNDDKAEFSKYIVTTSDESFDDPDDGGDVDNEIFYYGIKECSMVEEELPIDVDNEFTITGFCEINFCETCGYAWDLTGPEHCEECEYHGRLPTT